MNKTDKNSDVVIKKNGKDLSSEEISKLGLTVYRTEYTSPPPKTFKEFVSAFNALIESYNPTEDDGDMNIDDIEIGSRTFGNDDDLINELNNVYTPILVTQELEGDIAEPVNEACSADNILLERNIIKFDSETKFAQLVGVCGLLIARKKNSEEYEIFKKASQVKNTMKLRIQKNEHAAATALAKKYLDTIMSNSTSSVARKAAENLSNSNN